MAFNVTDIDPYACTHLIYAFAGLDAATNKIISLDPQVDIEEGIYKLVLYTYVFCHRIIDLLCKNECTKIVKLLYENFQVLMPRRCR